MGLENFLNDRMTEEDSYKFTLPEILTTRAKHTPDQVAYIFLEDGESSEEKISYKELDRAAEDIARRLTDMGMQGERALMLYPPGLDFIKALFGCYYAGVVAVPAYPPRKNRSLERIRLMVIDSGAKIVLTTYDIHKTFERSFSDVEELKGLTWLPTNPTSTSTSNILSPNHPITQSPNHPIRKSSLFCNTPPVPPASPKG